MTGKITTWKENGSKESLVIKFRASIKFSNEEDFKGWIESMKYVNSHDCEMKSKYFLNLPTSCWHNFSLIQNWKTVLPFSQIIIFVSYSQDTINLMASMEARLSLEGSEATTKHHRNDLVADDHRKPRLAPPTSAKKITTTSTSKSKTAANKAKQAAERLAAWQRRKNYDPLKAATNGKVQQVRTIVIENILTSLLFFISTFSK